MIHGYDQSGRYGENAAPDVEIVLEWRGRQMAVRALIDTGASTTGLTRAEFNRLKLKRIGDPEEVGGVANTKADNVVVNLTVEGETFRNLPVLVLDDLPFVVIGRDLLNKYLLTCNGPSLIFQITSPTPSPGEP